VRTAPPAPAPDASQLEIRGKSLAFLPGNTPLAEDATTA
jgi:hypothetical protein